MQVVIHQVEGPVLTRAEFFKTLKVGDVFSDGAFVWIKINEDGSCLYLRGTNKGTIMSPSANWGYDVPNNLKLVTKLEVYI